MSAAAPFLAPLVASLIFLGMLAAIFSEKIDRSLAAILGSALMLTAGRLLGFYTEDQAIASIDLYTLGLLLGMMILVALLEPTGFFQYVAIWAGRLSGGRPLRLLILLGVVTSVLSMFLDNVTTAILIAPMTVLLCEILGLSPLPYLIAEALLSNTGGVATLIGDPPNVIIGAAAGFSFNSFLTHTLPVVLVAWLGAVLLLSRLFRNELRPSAQDGQALLQLDPRRSLNEPRTARRVLVILAAATGLFFFHNRLGISPAFVAMGMAALALAWIRPALPELVQRVEWEVLLFFVALFITVGGLEASGVLHGLTGLLERLTFLPPALFGMLLLWFSAGLSAIVDNVPITIALVPVIQELGASGMNPVPLWWALAFGAGFGGNGTIIGSTATIIVVSLSRKTHSPITAALWIRRGLPVMLLTLVIASLLYFFFYSWFEN